jgi:predicted NBD/HSP70 family sugar kinase
LINDQQAYRVFLKDLFSSLVPVVSVLDPDAFFIHGQPFSDERKVREILSEEAPQFEAALRKIECRLVFAAEDEAVVAKGAAMMFLHKLYSIPELSELEERTRFNWDEVIAIARRGK